MSRTYVHWHVLEQKALSVLRFPEGYQRELFIILAAILHIGNITFETQRNQSNVEKVHVSSPDVIR